MYKKPLPHRGRGKSNAPVSGLYGAIRATSARAQGGTDLPCRRRRHGRDTASNNQNRHRQARPDMPSDKDNKTHLAGTRPRVSSAQGGTYSEWAQNCAADLRPFSIPPASSRLTLSNPKPSIRPAGLKSKYDLTFFVFYSVLCSCPPMSQASAAPGSSLTASATADRCARSGSAGRAGSSHTCQVERATPASLAACACERLQSLRMCFNLPLMIFRYSAAGRRLKIALCVYTSYTSLKKNHRTKCPTHPRPRPAGVFTILPGAF